VIGSVSQYQAEVLAAEKGRRKREEAERDRRDQAADEMPDTGAQAVAEGHLAAIAAEEASKFAADAHPGPDQSMRPRPVQPEMFDRQYIDAGHGAESPQAQAPRENPMPPVPPGIMTPIALRAAPAAALVSPHIAASYCMGSPSERAR
jgi:hypothetical protein